MLDKIFMVRHGRTILNIENKYQGVSQTDLHYLGMQDIASVACKLESLLRTNKDAKHLYCSPLRRAVESAHIIIDHLENIDIIYSEVEELKERDCGLWEGLTKEEAQAQFPEIYSQYRNDKVNTRLPNGESIKDVQCRVVPIVKSLENGMILVSHQTTIRVLIEAFFPEFHDKHSEINIPHGSVIVCDKLSTRNPTLSYI